ncbi:hypothetical protein SAMN05421743_1262 [Thalassobacillus cyri]|uniref:Hook-length control protein FliK n=1 Tax=Thalassobacillus cyri TaxID=571932 RepID=A0A1H4HCR2_9BACI|nr:hypothetical protein [Thalassobacillus cyri]SEB19456.1 hypothetical protein SAMN05421743_1262 [Thalassobacillus cyri]
MQASATNLFQALHRVAAPNAPVLRPGQMLSGSVKKLLPNNRATVSLGDKQVTAHLEASLTLGKKYLFQVQSTDEVIHLKMVSKQAGTQIEEMSELLKRLGMKATSENIRLLEQLITRNIPFRQSSLKQAAAILKNSPNAHHSLTALLHLFEKELPVRPAIVNALIARDQSQWTELLAKLEDSLLHKQSLSNTENNLLARITSMRGSGSADKGALTATLLHHVMNGNTQSFQVMKQAGVISEGTSFDRFQRLWLQWAVNQGIKLQSRESAASIQAKLMTQHLSGFPFDLTSETFSRGIMQLYQQQLSWNKTSHATLNQWMKALDALLDNPDRGVSSRLLQHQNHLEKQVFPKLFKHLPDIQAALQHFRETATLGKIPTNEQLSLLHQVRELVAATAGNQLSTEGRKTLTTFLHTLPTSPELSQRLLLQMKTTLQFAGLDDEASFLKQVLTNENIQGSQSLKSILLQAIQEQSVGKTQSERMQQLVHFLNGVQLTAHQENPQMAQMSLVFPGTLLKSRQDIHMNIEGRKNEEGGIDPEFCHVLFYLDLENLKETVIDMSIYDSKVGLTIYNHDPALLRTTANLQTELEAGLEKVGYQLTSLQIKKITETNKPSVYHGHFSERGVDYRI